MLALLIMATPSIAVAQGPTNVFQNEDSLAVPGPDVCPTIDKPGPFETWFNVPDMEKRGFYDPKNNVPWDYAIRIGQVICGAKQDSKIKIGMYFIRALGTMTSETDLGDRPETDPEVIYRALEHVAKKRNVEVGLVLDGGTITPNSARSLIIKRFKQIPNSKIYWCENGCFNTNKPNVFPTAINHEKFLTISDTIWDKTPGPHPVVFSSSGNFARSQVRNYWQEASLVYDDKLFFKAFDVRYDGMVSCANDGCSTDKKFPAALQLKKDRGIWVDPIYRHYTDAGRATTVSFSPQPSDVRDFYVQQFDNVDCTVDNKIRIAMFKLTDSKAKQMVDALVRLKKRGCDVEMILTSQGGATTISKDVVKLLNANKISAKCSAVAMHTKMILIGPQVGNYGRVLYGTANMSTSGLRYSEEHIVTIDARRASPEYVDDVRRVYGQYMAGWYELAQGSKAC